MFSDEKVVLGDKRRGVRLGLARKVAHDLKLYFENPLFVTIAVHRHTSEHGLSIRVGKETRSSQGSHVTPMIRIRSYSYLFLQQLLVLDYGQKERSLSCLMRLSQLRFDGGGGQSKIRQLV